MLSSFSAAQNCVQVSECPKDGFAWKIESDKKNCQGYKSDYLCAAIENKVGTFGEICTKFLINPASKYLVFSCVHGLC